MPSAQSTLDRLRAQADALLRAGCPGCGVPWPPSLDDVETLPCLEPDHPHPGRRHWHRSGRTLGQLLEWT